MQLRLRSNGRLIGAMTRKGVGVRQLARDANVSAGMISHLRVGRSLTVNQDAAQRIAAVLSDGDVSVLFHPQPIRKRQIEPSSEDPAA